MGLPPLLPQQMSFSIQEQHIPQQLEEPNSSIKEVEPLVKLFENSDNI